MQKLEFVIWFYFWLEHDTIRFSGRSLIDEHMKNQKLSLTACNLTVDI